MGFIACSKSRQCAKYIGINGKLLKSQEQAQYAGTVPNTGTRYSDKQTQLLQTHPTGRQIVNRYTHWFIKEF